ncbi:MAG: hypothetical protein RML40_04940 [Bacteroidota bacterium]|nr:hypothetical protein [Candidatus Kapabacteria bacterium]MDW8219858.1 hypothetical protein [Bacteroidota bacterium]
MNSHRYHICCQTARVFRVCATLAAIIVAASACQTIQPVDNTPGTLVLNFSPVVGSRAFDTSSTFAVNGRNIRFLQGQIYISDITLVKSDGSMIKLTDDPISIRAAATGDTSAATPIAITERVLYYIHQRGETSRTLPNIPAGKYTGIRFTIGINNPINQIDASEVLRLRPQHPLALISGQAGVGRNWWSWNTGYIFARIEGLCDTSATGTGTPNVRFLYHIGATGFTAPIALNRSFDIKGNQTTTIPLVFDYAKVLTGIDLRNPQERSTMVIRPAASFPNDRALGQRIVANIATAVSVQ